MFIDIRNLQERRNQRDSQFEGTRDIRNGYLFEVNGSVEGDRDGMVWFKALDDNSEPFQIFYGGVIGDLRANMFVKIERNPKEPARWQIIEFDTGIYFDDQSTYEQLPSTSVIPKKEDYEWPPGYPGAKALNIFPRAITDFAVRPTSPASMKARVYSGIYPGATNYARFQGPVNTKDFTADVPGAGLARLAAISIDNTGTLNYTNGTTFVDGLPMPDASLPAVPASQMLISAVRLVNGMTAIEESNFDLEMRPLMANGTVNVKVSEVWESDFGAVALSADAAGDLTVVNSMALSAGEVITIDSNEVPVIVDSVTKTVKAIGGDFTTIQAAVNWFKEKLIVGSCIIDVEAAIYAESVIAVDLFIGATGSLEIQGDARVLAGQSYVDGAETNTSSKANGGTGVFTLANAVNDITVTGATTNPDFDADGWGNGDKILAYDNAGATAEHTIDSVLNNVITLTAAAPALGNDATAIVLQPDRKISGTTAITIDGPRGLQVTGIYLVGSTHGLEVSGGGLVIVSNCASRSTIFNFVATDLYSSADCRGGANSAWGGSQGFRANNTGSILAQASVAVGPLTGYRAQSFSFVNGQNAVGVNCTTAFDPQIFANIELFQAYARQNTTGYRAQSFSFIRALQTNAKNNGNGTDYNPAVSGVHGNNGSMIQWT